MDFRHRLFHLLGLLAWTLLTTVPAQASQIQLEAEGSAAITHSRQQARQDAVGDAQRNAVAEALGVLLTSETVVENFVLLQDKILTRVEGYVRDYQILNESFTSNACTVRIRATVEEMALADDVAALARILPRLNYPTVAISLQEQSLSATANPMPLNLLAARQTIEADLRGKGFDLVNPTGPSTTQAQLLIRGQAYVQDNGANPYNERFHAYAATIVADICETTTGKVLASASSDAIVPHHSFAIGSQNALQKAALQLAGRLSDQIAASWLEACYNEHQIRLIVAGCSFADLPSIEREISRIPGVIRAQQKQFSAQGGEFIVGWQSCNTLRLAEQINHLTIGGKKLTITSAGTYALQARLGGS